MFLTKTLPTVIDDFKKKGLNIPSTLHIQSDRGPDVYNRCWLAFEEWLVLDGLFDRVTHSALPVKHTHDVRTLLASTFVFIVAAKYPRSS